MPRVRNCPVPGYVVDGFEDPRPTRRPDNVGAQLVTLGWEINANQYRLVHLAAEFADGDEWKRSGFPSAAHWIAQQLDIEPSTANEWIRIGRALRFFPLIDQAFRAGKLSYSKVRVLTRWASEDNEAELLAIARERPASRLNAAIAKALALDEDDDDRDKRHRQARSFSYYTSPDGMVVGTFRLPPVLAKQIIAAIEALVRLIARTPAGQPIPSPTNTPNDPHTAPASQSSPAAATSEPTYPATDATAGTSRTPTGAPTSGTSPDADPPAGVSSTPTVASTSGTSPDADPPAGVSSTPTVAVGPDSDDDADPPTDAPDDDGEQSGWVSGLAALRRRWLPQDDDDDDWEFPSMAQQRADALVMLFTNIGVSLTSEVIIHVRGDGNTFDDGTPLTDNAVTAMLPQSLVRTMIHDAEKRPINASGKQRYPTQRQQRVVMELHHHECIDCGSTDLLEIDHNPAYERTRHTITEELEPRCAPCHRARHRHENNQQRHAA